MAEIKPVSLSGVMFGVHCWAGHWPWKPLSVLGCSVYQVSLLPEKMDWFPQYHSPLSGCSDLSARSDFLEQTSSLVIHHMCPEGVLHRYPGRSAILGCRHVRSRGDRSYPYALYTYIYNMNSDTDVACTGFQSDAPVTAAVTGISVYTSHSETVS